LARRKAVTLAVETAALKESELVVRSADRWAAKSEQRRDVQTADGTVGMWAACLAVMWDDRSVLQWVAVKAARKVELWASKWAARWVASMAACLAFVTADL
jgi:hypothetical protein